MAMISGHLGQVMHNKNRGGSYDTVTANDFRPLKSLVTAKIKIFGDAATINALFRSLPFANVIQ